MYCNNCGKEILDTDKFCPFCGASIKKKILIEGNVTPEVVRKRAYILLEDGEFSDAADYFETLLDYEPENPSVYLGILLAQKGKRNLDELLSYYKKEYSNSYGATREVDLQKDAQEHISRMADEYFIENYFDKNEIKDLYDEYDNSYISEAEGIRNDKRSLLEEFENNTLISRIRSFGDKEISKNFDGLIKDYDERIKKAKRKEKSKEEEILAGYPAFIDKTDERVRMKHDKAVTDREDDYKAYIEKYEKIEDIGKLEDLCSKFALLCGYKESNAYIGKCKEKIEEIELKNKALEAEAAEKKKKTKTTAVIAALALIGFCLVYINVIVPSGKYSDAMKYYEEGRYAKALPLFEELGGYKDSKDMAELTMYHQGVEFLNTNEFENAISVFEKVKDVEDASSKLNEARYGFGNQLIEEKKFDQAMQVFEMIRSYRDSEEMIKKAKYGKGIVLREDRKYDDSIAIFEELGDFEDSADQKKVSEKEKADNSVKVPSLTGSDLASAKKALDKLELTYSITESEKADKKVGTVLSVSPETGTVLLKGSGVTLNVAKGLSKYDNYRSNNNTTVLYQINITPSGNNIIIRTAPHIDSSNKTGRKTKSGEAYNVYETVINEGYTYVRVDNDEWFATEPGWIETDRNCTSAGDYMHASAWINDPDGSGVWDRPNDSDARSQVDVLAHGTQITVYYHFYSGMHHWYKIGANRWVKDVYGEKVKFY